MNKYILLIMGGIFIFNGFVLGNVGPLSVHSNGGVSFEQDSLLSKNVVVNSEDITVQVLSGEQMSNENLDEYVGLDYLYDTISKKGFDKSLLDPFFLDTSGSDTHFYPTMFYKFGNIDHSGTMANFQVEYELENKSNKTIDEQLVGFTPLKVNSHRNYFLFEKIQREYTKCKDDNSRDDCSLDLDNLIIFYPAHKYAQDLEVNFGGKELLVFNKYQTKPLDDIDYGEGSSVGKYLFKKLPSFYLSFQPYETQTLKINYKIPLESLYYKSSDGLVYNFEPIFNRKNNILDELNIKVLGDQDHILNSNLSNFVFDSKEINFENTKEDVYKATLTGLENKNLKGLRFAFNNYEDLLGSSFCGVGTINSEFFCEKFDYQNETVEKTDSPYYINVVTNSGDDTKTTKRYSIFDVLK